MLLFRRSWKSRLRTFKLIFQRNPYLKLLLVIGSILALTIAGYFLLDEEDFIADNDPWPGVIYRSPDWARDDRSLKMTDDDTKKQGQKQIVTLAVVSCKSRMEEAITMVKSAILFSRNIRLNIIAVADKRSQLKLAEKIQELRNSAINIGIDVEYEVYRTWFPKENHRIWRRMWLPCSSQRLFFPSMFKHVDSVMYIDTDVYFVSDVGNLWKYFENMDSEHLAAMAAEHELPGDGWYNMKSKIPYYGPRGLNAGIMLMNLTRMREIKLEERAAAILETYGNDLMWADQDILNVLFHFYPEYLYELQCEYNFRAQHCKCDYSGGGCNCKSAIKNGAAVIHGNRARFHYYADPSLEFLRDFYTDFYQYDPMTNEPEKLLLRLKMSYDRVQEKPCEMSSATLLAQFDSYLKS